MNGTIRIEDMRLYASVAEANSFTAAAQRLGIPKQTLSRRIAELERALGVQLMHRTTRRLRLSDVGAAYAEKCAEMVRIADEANHAVSATQDVPRGVLRITADPVFGEAFLTDLLIDYARKWPEVHLDVVLTRRRVDLIEERFDVAFRIGQIDDAALSGVGLGPACVRYCASPAYIAARGVPATPEDLQGHECVLVVADEGPTRSVRTPIRWPFRGKKGPAMVPVSGRMKVTSFAIARNAVLAGLGIAIFPEFACAPDVRAKRLVPVLDYWVTDVGSVWLVHAARRLVAARVRAFAELARERFAQERPWLSRGAPDVRRDHLARQQQDAAIRRRKRASRA